jgi:hypothetical protein
MTNRPDVVSSKEDLNNSTMKEMTSMHRAVKTAFVALVAVAAGACAGRQLHVAAAPEPPSVQAAAPEILTLPTRPLTFQELLLPQAALASEPQPTPTLPACDLAAEALKSDPELDTVTLDVGFKDIRYTEVRGGVTKVFKDPEKQIALRVINKETCQQQIVTITKRGDKLIDPTGWDIEAVRRVNGIRWNNWATQYHINSPEGWVVIRDRYPLVKGEGKKRTVTYLTYSPYSEDLHLPVLVQTGRQYMTDLAQRALAILRERKVPSRAIDGMLLADTPIARPEVSARLGPIEHMDFGEFALDEQWSVEHAFIRIGLNGDEFARFTCSKAAACGLMQFTDNGSRDARGVLRPGTYTTLRRLYPLAKLNPSFEEGARDPLNAMIASYLHHDNALKYLIGRFGPSITDNHQILDELVGGIYNGGETYTGDAYAASLKKHVADWTQALKTCYRRPYRNCIPSETVGYVIKLRALIADEHTQADVLAQASAHNPPTQ